MKRSLSLITLVFGFVVVSVCFAWPVEASPRDTTYLPVYLLPEILVRAERLSDLEDIKNRPAFVAIVPMEDASKRLSNAADALAQTVGCHVQDAGSYGAYSTASVRGSSAKQVRVFQAPELPESG